jgi:hypothetical protein
LMVLGGIDGPWRRVDPLAALRAHATLPGISSPVIPATNWSC